MRTLELEKLTEVYAGNCISSGMAAPFMIIFSGFISSGYLDSWWATTVDNCFY